MVSNAFQYSIRIYPNVNGAYLTNGEPVVVWTVQNPDVSTNTYNRLTITETRGGTGRAHEFVWSEADQSWTLTTGGGLRREIKTSVWNQDQTLLTETHTIIDPASNQPIARTVQQFAPTAVGLKRIYEGTGGEEPGTTYSYYTNRETDGLAVGKLKQTTRPDGSWEIRTYEGLGRPAATYSAFGNQPPTTDNTLCRTVTYD